MLEQLSSLQLKLPCKLNIPPASQEALKLCNVLQMALLST